MLRTNLKIVSQRIDEHVKSFYANIEDLKADLNAVLPSGTTYQRGVALVDGGCFLCYNSQVADFLRETLEETDAELNKYGEESNWKLYRHLIGKSCERLTK